MLFTANFVTSVVLGGLRNKALVFVGKMQSHHFRRFRQIPSDKATVFQKHGFATPKKGCLDSFLLFVAFSFQETRRGPEIHG